MSPSDEQLESHLLGDVGAGPGLLRRVGAKVADLTRDEGPGFVTSSVMGVGSVKHDSDPSEDAARVLDLAIALIEWRGQRGIGTATSSVRRMLITYIRQNRISDAELLLGSKRLGVGHIEMTRREVRNALRLGQRDRCEELERYLIDWLSTECDHDFEPAASDDEHSTVMVCAKPNCRAQYWTHRRDETWLAVG